MYYYAKLNMDFICEFIHASKSRIEAGDFFVCLESEAIEVIGQRYNKGIWEDVSQPEPIPLPLSPTEQAILQTAINTEYTMSLMEVKG